MMVCVSYSVHRGNDIENAEWIGDELRGLPARLQPCRQDYDVHRSTGWLLVPNLEQAVGFLREYGPGRCVSYLRPRAMAVSPAADLPSDLDDLAFARTVLAGDQDDRYYLIHPGRAAWRGGGHPPGAAMDEHSQSQSAIVTECWQKIKRVHQIQTCRKIPDDFCCGECNSRRALMLRGESMALA